MTPTDGGRRGHTAAIPGETDDREPQSGRIDASEDPQIRQTGPVDSAALRRLDACGADVRRAPLHPQGWRVLTARADRALSPLLAALLFGAHAGVVGGEDGLGPVGDAELDQDGG